MNAYENIPSSNSHKKFPVGDIDDFTASLADTWLKSYSNSTDVGEQRMRIASEMTGCNDVYKHAPNLTHVRALELCGAWDDHEKNESNIAKTGYAFGILLRKRMFAHTYANFSQELQYMKKEQSGNARQFGATAWRSMDLAHPKLHNIYDRYAPLAMNFLDVKKEQLDPELFRAGLMLPYILSVGTHLTQGTPTFTGMRKLKEGQDLLPTSNSLTNDTALMTSAPHSPEDYMKLKGSADEL